MTRDFIKKVCLRELDLEVIAEAGTGGEAVENITRTHPDIVLLDVGLPDFDGIEVLARIRANGVRPRVLILSSHRNPFTVFRIEQVGVQGFVDKRDQTVETLRLAIGAVRCNRTYFSESFLEAKSQRRLDPLAFDKLLTNQQISVLSMVADLFGDAEIAASLSISERTVEAHRTAIMRKLDVHTRIELISRAKILGFTSGLRPQNAADSGSSES